MANQSEVLKVLAVADDPLSLRTICEKLKLDPDSRADKKDVQKAIGKLMVRQFVERTALSIDKPGFTPTPAKAALAVFTASDIGREFFGLGKAVKSGPRGAHSGPFNPGERKQFFRQRLWSAMLLQRGWFTLADILELARRPTDNLVKTEGNAQKFLWSLAAAGIVNVKQAKAAKGNRYAVLKNLGPDAPYVGRQDVFDPNSGQRIAFKKRAEQ